MQTLNILGGAVVDRSKKCLFWFLKTRLKCSIFKQRVHKVYEIINYIAGRFKNRNVFQKSKGAFVHLLWNNVQAKFQEAAKKIGNERAV